MTVMRDMLRLANKRVDDAVTSVLQLIEREEGGLVLTTLSIQMTSLLVEYFSLMDEEFAEMPEPVKFSVAAALIVELSSSPDRGSVEEMIRYNKAAAARFIARFRRSMDAQLIRAMATK